MAKKKDFIVTIGSPPQEHTAWTKPDDIVTIKKNQQIHNNTTLLNIDLNKVLTQIKAGTHLLKASHAHTDLHGHILY